MLCEACAGVITDMEDNEPAVLEGTHKARGHHRTIEGLHKAALAECYICSQLFRIWGRRYWVSLEGRPKGASEAERDRTMIVEVTENQQRALGGKYDMSRPFTMKGHDYVSRYSLSRLINQDSSAREIEFTATGKFFDISLMNATKGTKNNPHIWWIWFIALPSPRVQQYTLIQDRPLNQRSSDKWRQSLAQRWFQNCLKNHPLCSPNKSDWRPTRLLQVSKTQPSMVKLILTKLEQVTEHSQPYLTLSHCWGNSQFLTLTAQTQDQLLEGVNISILPKTFQDALNMTNFLGFEYLWIDSLCIFQDSIDDWTVESALMGDVYGHGICNLAATGSADGNGGLWMSRPPSLSLPCEVRSNHRPATDHIWHIHPRYLSVSTLLLAGPLLKRGWVVQERILAPRTLHFGTYQLFWECRHHQACETYPGGLPNLMQSEKSNLVSFDALQKTIGNGANGNQTQEVTFGNVKEFWAKVVTGYSQCDLTKAEDKLVAISGLARRIQERHPQYDFIAGMLRQSLSSDLLWYVYAYGNNNVFPRSTAFRAPSWSWASVDTGVIMRTPLDTSRVMNRILDIEVQEGDDPKGQNISVTLRIEAYLMTLVVRSGSEGPRFCINGAWHQSYASYGYGDELHAFRDANEPYHNLHCLVMKDEGKEPSLGQGQSPEVKLGLWALSCLLIQPTGAKKGEFRRYGKFEFFGYDHKLLQRSDLKTVQNEEWLEYESVGEDGKYIVTLV